MCVPIRLHLCMYAYKKACTTFILPIIIVHVFACVDMHRVDKRKLSISSLRDTHINTHAIPRTHTLTRLLEKGVRIWEGMVLCIRSSLAICIHRGTLAYIRCGIRLECARGGEAGGGRQSCRHAATCIHT